MVSYPFQWILQPRHNLQPPAKAYIHMHAPLLLAHSAKHAKELTPLQENDHEDRKKDASWKEFKA